MARSRLQSLGEMWTHDTNVRFTHVSLTLAVMFALAACSTTKAVDHWQAESFSRSSIDHVLIIGATTNRGYRLIFENEFEQRLTKGGLKSVKSVDVLGDQVPDREAVEAYVAKHNIDYVVATKLERADVETTYVPPSAVTYYTGPYYPSYGQLYGSTVTLVKEGYSDTRSTLILVTTIFDAKSGDPVWVGRSATFEPGSVGVLAGEIARITWTNIAP